MLDFCIITVTFNSSKLIQYFIDSINKSANESSFHIFISDNNSLDINKLKKIVAHLKYVTIIESQENFGFCKGNNIAVNQALKLNPNNILFINPDLFLTENWLDRAFKIIENDKFIGILSGPLLHFDFVQKKPTGVIDSLGINVTKYGKWFDINQGKEHIQPFQDCFFPKAICGALLLINKNIIEQILKKDGYIFDEKYFMYKEDVDLSLRITELGYKLIINPSLIAYHCRGWRKNRRKMPFLAKKLSAINDIRIALKYRLVNLPFAILKLVYVYCFEYPFQK